MWREILDEYSGEQGAEQRVAESRRRDSGEGMYKMEKLRGDTERTREREGGREREREGDTLKRITCLLGGRYSHCRQLREIPE